MSLISQSEKCSALRLQLFGGYSHANMFYKLLRALLISILFLILTTISLDPIFYLNVYSMSNGYAKCGRRGILIIRFNTIITIQQRRFKRVFVCFKRIYLKGTLTCQDSFFTSVCNLFFKWLLFILCPNCFTRKYTSLIIIAAAASEPGASEQGSSPNLLYL